MTLYSDTWEYFDSYVVHEKHNESCKGCGYSYPKQHSCGGLVHLQIQAGDCYNYYFIRCDECGFEDELDKL